MHAAGLAATPDTGLAGQRLRTLVIVVVTALTIAIVAWVINQPTADGLTEVTIAAGPGAPPQVGEAPPAFNAVDVDGVEVGLSDYVGKPVWLTFGASWCADCRAESPDLQATYARYAAQGLVVLGVFIEEDDAAVREYADRLGFTFPMVADPQDRIAGAYHLLGIPTHYFIGPDGRIEQVRLGGLHADEMDRLVQGLLD
jgi:peroxiredoxin